MASMRSLLLLLLLPLLLLPLLPTLVTAADLSTDELPVAHTPAQTISDNRFVVDRRLDEYFSYLGPDFEKALSLLHGGDHWLDAGAGEGMVVNGYLLPLRTAEENESIRQTLVKNEASLALWMPLLKSLGTNSNSTFYSTSNIDGNQGPTRKFSQLPENNKANVTLISYRMSEEQEKKLISFSKIKVFNHRFFEDIDNREITERYGKVNLITDLYGVIFYTDRFSESLQKYADLLHPGGKVFIYLGNHYSYHCSLHSHYVQMKNKSEINMVAWMMHRTSDCFHALYPNEEDGFLIVLTRNEKMNCHIPQLKFVEYCALVTPPARVFAEIE
ncbi:MAG: hypothetical protein HQK53_09240 [Oligoflexia bacterium]|nr:hypothetical protein [Oligoflexia bacterium]